MKFETSFGLGSIIAALISWSLNHSIGWVILHALFGWLYVIYAVIKFNLF